MSVTIKRNTGWSGSGSRAVIKLNGKKVAEVSEKQEVRIDIPNEKVKLRISLMGIKSSELEVKDGEIIEITPTRWYKNLNKIILILILLSAFVSGLFPSVRKSIFIMTLWILLLISLFLIDGFHLSVLEN